MTSTGLYARSRSWAPENRSSPQSPRKRTVSLGSIASSVESQSPLDKYMLERFGRAKSVKETPDVTNAALKRRLSESESPNTNATKRMRTDGPSPDQAGPSNNKEIIDLTGDSDSDSVDPDLKPVRQRAPKNQHNKPRIVAYLDLTQD
ncbi:hypothetical protein VNI00_016515 [Paramarasmius palmivorus]|uniref:Uncharacterized protein n=1 Tax=Paramarasmius palmivorus TaxID=297713 RepID=A0AAW0BE61_9AGAR